MLMKLLILGRGKTGSLVADVARHSRHDVRVAGASENAACAALAADKLRDIDVVIDFTTPSCVVGHIEACVCQGKNMVVGTTGWYAELDRVRRLVESYGSGFLYAANFSVGVNLFLEVACAAAGALRHDDFGAETHQKPHRRFVDVGVEHGLRAAVQQRDAHFARPKGGEDLRPVDV